MPLIRYTYPRDVARYGSDPIEVPGVTARVLVERRRAVVLDVAALLAVEAEEAEAVAEAEEADG